MWVPVKLLGVAFNVATLSNHLSLRLCLTTRKKISTVRRNVSCFGLKCQQ